MSKIDEMFEEFCPKTDETNIGDIQKLDISITNSSYQDGVGEIISNLEKIYKNFSTFSMNDSTIKYFGQKEMLGEIIKYLKRCL